MKITNGLELRDAQISERRNIGDYLDRLAEWTYRYIHVGNREVLARVKEVNKPEAGIHIEVNKLTPEEIGIVALAGRYYKPNFPQGDISAEQDFAEYQFQLQTYLGITNPDDVVAFYDDLVSSVKPEHNKLIPVLHIHHAQIHALKIGYDSLKVKMGKNPSLTTRAIFGLICVELMKLQVRLYLVEPAARTEDGKNLDWIFMLDKVFDDFSRSSKRNIESLRRKNVVSIDAYRELGLDGVFEEIRNVRDEVDALKREKLGFPPERKSKDPILPINPTGYLRVIRDVQGKVEKGKGK